MKQFFNWLLFIFAGYGKIADEAEAEGLIDRKGQK